MAAALRPAPAQSDPGRAQALARALVPHLRGGVAANAFSRGRYATDASIYQIVPLAVAQVRDQCPG